MNREWILMCSRDREKKHQSGRQNGIIRWKMQCWYDFCSELNIKNKTKKRITIDQIFWWIASHCRMKWLKGICQKIIATDTTHLNGRENYDRGFQYCDFDKSKTNRQIQPRNDDDEIEIYRSSVVSIKFVYFAIYQRMKADFDESKEKQFFFLHSIEKGDPFFFCVCMCVLRR